MLFPNFVVFYESFVSEHSNAKSFSQPIEFPSDFLRCSKPFEYKAIPFPTGDYLALSICLDSAS
jgi:hypothetical protein